MKLVDKMVEGKKYEIEILEEGTLVGEFKGWANDAEWFEYVIFWEDGKSSGTLVHAGEILKAKAVK